MGLLSDALGAGLSPEIGQTMLSQIQSEAAQRVADLQARRAAQQQAAQAALGQLGSLAVQTAQTTPDMPQEQLSGLLNAQEASLGLGPNVAQRVENRLPDVVGALYPQGQSIFAQGGMDPADEQAVTQMVAQGVTSGTPLTDIMSQIQAQAIAAGVDPQLYSDKAREVYARFDPNSTQRQEQINTFATDINALTGFEEQNQLPSGVVQGNDLLTLARQAYAANLANRYTPAPNPYLTPAG